MRALVATVGVLLAFLPAAGSTTIPLSFADVIGKSGVIFRSEVVSQRAEWRMKAGSRAIVTIVDFRVERALKGLVGGLRTVEFLGGTIGDEELVMAGMPRFAVGDRDVICLRDTADIFPVVGGTQGRFKVVRGTDGIERVLFADGTPIPTVTSVGQARVLVSASPLVPLRLDAFETAILDEVRRAR